MLMKDIVIVDDDKNIAKTLAFILEAEGYEVKTFNDPWRCMEYLLHNRCDLLLADYSMPKSTGIELLSKLKLHQPETAIVIITAYGTVEVAVEAMKLGAYDFISKPIDNEKLKITVQNAIRFVELQKENRQLKEQLYEKYKFENIVGAGLPMQEVFSLMSKVCKTEATVLIGGETGTGKELVAKAIHYNSARANKPFIAVSCSAIPKELVASELFGHKKGAFTGASSDYKGKFLLAHQGSIFLDEIATIPYDVQDKLLRVLQERAITPLGDETEFAVDVRIIAATNSDLESMIKAGIFREDLYYRLNVFPIHIPPLRERIDDLPLLIKHFIKKYCKFELLPNITPKAYQILTSYHWPGNIRELENVIERALILSDGRDIYPDHIPERLRHLSRKSENFSIELPDSGIVLDELEKELILKALQKTEGNQTKAAALLGISRHALIYRMEKHGISEGEGRRKD